MSWFSVTLCVCVFFWGGEKFFFFLNTSSNLFSVDNVYLFSCCFINVICHTFSRSFLSVCHHFAMQLTQSNSCRAKRNTFDERKDRRKDFLCCLMESAFSFFCFYAKKFWLMRFVCVFVCSCSLRGTRVSEVLIALKINFCLFQCRDEYFHPFIFTHKFLVH